MGASSSKEKEEARRGGGMSVGTPEHAKDLLETAAKSSHFWALAYIQEVKPLLAEIARLSAEMSAWKILASSPGVVRATEAKAKTPIVCLCGSTHFMDAFFDEGWRLTLEGKIVLSVGVWREGPTDHAGEWIGEEVKHQLDELHKRKIDLADEVFVLNVGGYIGESTRSEIEYAEAHNKPVQYLEPLAAYRGRA